MAKPFAVIGILAVVVFAGFGFFFWGSTPSHAACLSYEGPDRPAFAQTSLTIERQGGATVTLTTEIADTAEKRAYGLMYVRAMEDSCGMIFIYPTVQPVAFWMRNTFIPLDLLFFDGTGKLHHIHQGAVPHDETPLRSGGPTWIVLEIAAGAASRHGFAPGDRLKLPLTD